MQETVTKLPPVQIVDAYDAEKGPAARLDALWTKFGTKTIERMSAGVLCLAEIWASAWKEGDGEHQIAKSDLVAQDQGELAQHYRPATFYPSMSLERMIPLLEGTASPTPAVKAVALVRRGRKARPPRMAKGGRARPAKRPGRRRRAS